MTTEERQKAVEDGADTIEAFCAFTGLGRTWVYQAMQSGLIRSCKVGKRRLIPRSEARRLLAESLVESTSN